VDPWFWHILTGEPISLNRPILSAEDGCAELGTLIPDPDSPDPHEETARRWLAREVHRALARIGRRDVRYPYILRHRFGLEGADVMTLEQLGQRLNLSRERVRQLQGKAMALLRQELKHVLD